MGDPEDDGLFFHTFGTDGKDAVYTYPKFLLNSNLQNRLNYSEGHYALFLMPEEINVKIRGLAGAKRTQGFLFSEG